MNLSREEIAALEIKGSIDDVLPLPPDIEELRRMALAERPDVISYRLGILRAEADVRLARANRINDLYVLFQPFTYQDNTPFGLKMPRRGAGSHRPPAGLQPQPGAIQRGAERRPDEDRTGRSWSGRSSSTSRRRPRNIP